MIIYDVILKIITTKIIQFVKKSKNDSKLDDFSFLVADKRLYKRLCPSVGPSVRRLVGRSVVIELESVKTRISAPAHLSATGIGRVFGLFGQRPQRADVL